VAVSIRDPVHGSIAVDDWVLPIIDHPVFQRLRRVQQLGTAHLVYPGAHHKRFEHSLGAYHLAGLLGEGLELDETEHLTMRAGALLHDIGHGPFSHAFEELLRESGHRHETTSVDLVRWGPMADLLRQGGLDPVAVSEAVVGEGPLAPIVSGALDADRMDYLLRDAHYTGVRANVDPDRLRRVVRRHDEHGVVILESGLLAAEGLLTTRFLMYPAVYFHHAVRGSEAMLIAAIRALVAAATDSEAPTPLMRLQRETDDGLMQQLRAAGGVAADLARRLDERRLYKRAVTVRSDHFGSAWVQKCLRAPEHHLRLAGEIAAQAGVAEHDVLLDVPAPPSFHEATLHVLRREGDVVPITEASSLVRILHEARLDHWRAWVFAPPRHAAAVAAAAREVLAV
jgi:hypothetical protein